MAERVRFELTSPVRSLRFSRPVQSTALPPLRSNQLNHLRAFYQAAETDSEVDVSILFPLCVSSSSVPPWFDTRTIEQENRAHLGSWVRGPGGARSAKDSRQRNGRASLSGHGPSKPPLYGGRLPPRQLAELARAVSYLLPDRDGIEREAQKFGRHLSNGLSL